MKKIRKGSALTTVILVIFIMSVIGASIMNVVVYNYRMRNLDLNIGKAEYKNEIIMDKIYEITQNTIITAIDIAKEQAINAVDKAVHDEEILYSQYIAEQERLTIEWCNLNKVNNADGYQDVLRTYIEENLDREYVFEYLTNGVLDQYKVQLEYNKVFQQVYKYILDNNQDLDIDGAISKYLNVATIDDICTFNNIHTLLENIQDKEKYRSIMSNVDNNLFIDNETEFYARVENKPEDDLAYIEHDLSYNATIKKLVLNNEILYKVKGTPTAVLSADFIITVPNFEDVSGLQQKAVKFSNPLVGNKALIAGGKLNIAPESNVYIDGDAFIKNSINPDEDAINIEKSQVNVTGKLVTGGDIRLVNSEIATGIAFYNNLYIMGENGRVTFNGNVYARDDLEILSNKFEIKQSNGNYYGFNDVNDKGPDASSSIIINSSDFDPDSYITLDNLYLAGRAFIDGVKNVEKPSEIYKTGESISVKGNYIAYQTPIMNPENVYMVKKVNFGSYISNSKVALNLVNSFAGKQEENQLAYFDVNCKWRYFLQFWKEYSSLIKIPKITIKNITYMQGAGVGRITESGVPGVLDASPIAYNDQAFKTNCANEFNLQTQKFGYESGKTEIFGDNGWLEEITAETEIESPRIYVHNGDMDVLGSVFDDYKIVICSGNLTVTGEANFSGVVIVGGDIKLSGNIIINSDRNGVISEIAQGGSEDSEPTPKKLYSLFKYDDSGTIYIITTTGESYINMNKLIGIINWQKKDWGYL